MNSGENPQHDFPKMRGGQRPFGTFLKIHPFLKGQASLSIGSGTCAQLSYLRYIEVKMWDMTTISIYVETCKIFLNIQFFVFCRGNTITVNVVDRWRNWTLILPWWCCIDDVALMMLHWCGVFEHYPTQVWSVHQGMVWLRRTSLEETYWRRITWAYQGGQKQVSTESFKIFDTRFWPQNFGLQRSSKFFLLLSFQIGG